MEPIEFPSRGYLTKMFVLVTLTIFFLLSNATANSRNVFYYVSIFNNSLFMVVGIHNYNEFDFLLIFFI
jgi:hypothetical protein